MYKIFGSPETVLPSTEKMNCAAFTPEAHTIENGVCTVCGASITNCTVSVYLPNNGNYSATTYTMATGAAFNLPAAPEASTPDYMEFSGWRVGVPAQNESFETDGNEALLDTGVEYTISSDVSFTARYHYIDISLADDASNSAILYTYDGKKAHSVTLTDRKFWKDGNWNTLCLPFAVDNFSGTPLADATVKTLELSAFDSTTGTLTLNFTEDTNNLTSIEAGKPYIVKWSSGTDTTNPKFENVTISNAANNVEKDNVDFIGSYSPKTIASEDRSILYLGDNNTLYYPKPALTDPDAEYNETTNPYIPVTINACRTYFRLKGITAGDKSAGSRSFVLNFGEDATGIVSTTNYTNYTNSDAWYTLDGRKLSDRQLSNRQLPKGVYIYKGKKRVIK